MVDREEPCVEIYRGVERIGTAREALDSELTPGFSLDLRTILWRFG